MLNMNLCFVVYGRVRDVEEEVWSMQGTIILEGRYRIVRCLSRRPRLNLYLGRRLPADEQLSSFLNDLPSQKTEQGYEPLVAIRELVLTGLSPQTRTLIEAVAFEEFVAPSVFGSSHLPAAGDRVWIKGERHYLVMQLSDAKTPQYVSATLLDALLLAHATWPEWIDEATSFHWTIQLCRMVARLHRQGIVLGNLTPASILVDGQGATTWSPVLLPSWPPAPSYWKIADSNDVSTAHAQIFPIADKPIDSVFAAPELLNSIADERSDVYSLGAILYLLLTHFAPIAPARRQRARISVEKGMRRGSIVQERVEGLELIPLRFLNESISPLVEQIVLHALELEPVKRYQSAFAFVEALEAIVL